MQRNALTACDVVVRVALAAALALFGSSLAQAQVYKWVDEKGVTQYGASPPPGKGQIITNTPAAGNAPKAAEKAQSWQDKELDFRERRALADEKERKDEKDRLAAQRRAAVQRESCISARSDLQSMNEKRPMYSLNERGDRVFVEDKDRPRIIENLKLVIARDCPK